MIVIHGLIIPTVSVHHFFLLVSFDRLERLCLRAWAEMNCSEWEWWSFVACLSKFDPELLIVGSSFECLWRRLTSDVEGSDSASCECLRKVVCSEGAVCTESENRCPPADSAGGSGWISNCDIMCWIDFAWPVWSEDLRSIPSISDIASPAPAGVT